MTTMTMPAHHVADAIPANRRTTLDGFPTAAPGSDIHGELVSWEWAESGATFGFSDVRDALTAAGLNPDVARAMLPQNAFARAARKLAERRIIRRVGEDQTTIRFQFTAEELAGDRFEYALETILSLDKTTGAITCDHVELAARARSAMDAETGRRGSSDVSAIVRRLFSDKRKADLDLIPLRKQGGVYFVRRERLEFVDQIEDFLGRLGATVMRLPIAAGSASGDRTVKVAVATAIQDLIGEFDATVSRFGEETGERAINAAAERIKVARFKVESYAEYLLGERERLDAAVTAAQQRLREKVREITRLKEEHAGPGLPIG